MTRAYIVRLTFLLVCTSIVPRCASADLLLDNASNAAYNDGWQVGDNGGTGFSAWSTIGRDNGTGFGGGFIVNSDGAVNIGTGGNNAAWGIFGNGGGVGQAVRSFNSALPVGLTFNIDMDNQNIDTGGTVGFGLQNSSGNNLVEFFFVGGQANYTVHALNVVGTTPGFTAGGLRLSLTLTSANAFTMNIDRLANGIGVDNTVTGNLLASPDQSISGLRLFNANGGPDVFFNSLSAVPEVSPVLAVPTALLLAGVVSFGWQKWRSRLTAN